MNSVRLVDATLSMEGRQSGTVISPPVRHLARTACRMPDIDETLAAGNSAPDTIVKIQLNRSDELQFQMKSRCDMSRRVGIAARRLAGGKELQN
jgi:hypothetical protein